MHAVGQGDVTKQICGATSPIDRSMDIAGIVCDDGQWSRVQAPFDARLVTKALFMEHPTKLLVGSERPRVVGTGLVTVLQAETLLP